MKSAIQSRRLGLVLVATCLSAGIAWSGTALGQAADPLPWQVSGKLFGKLKNNGLQYKESENVSGIACATTTGFPRICLLVDDESQGAQIVILEDGKLIAGEFVRLIDDSFAGKPVELDAEGAAFADGYFYVVGSHGRPRHEEGADDWAEIAARAEASSRIFRIRFAPNSIDMKNGKLSGKPDITPSLKLTGIVRSRAELTSFVGKPLKENGLTVEGVAVRNGDLYVGLRGPVLPDDHEAVILPVPLGVFFDGGMGETPPIKVDLGTDSTGAARGIRDLATFEGRLLILAGPVHDPPDGHPIARGDYTVFSYDGHAAKRLLDLEGYGEKIKPEALLPLDESAGKLRALLLFDGPDEGQPTPIQIE